MEIRRKRRHGSPALWIGAALVIGLLIGALVYRTVRPSAGRLVRLRTYWAAPDEHTDWAMIAGERCGEAPFLFPSDGYIGVLWGDSFRPGHTHQGIDVFGPSGPNGLGETPVVAAYDGYLTRLPEWRSSVIIRIPSDPLRPDRHNAPGKKPRYPPV